MIRELFSSYSPDSDLFIFHGGKLSFGDSVSLTRDLQGARVSNQLVLSLIDNRPEALLGYVALLNGDAIQMLQSEDLQPSALSNIISRFRPGFVWLPIERASELPSYETIIAVGTYCLCASGKKSPKMHPDLAILLSTSGSTGSPKFVRISKRNLIENAKAIRQYLAISASERPITTLPPSYTYGLSVLHSHICAGATVIVTPKSFFDRDFWELFNVVGATSFGGVPYHYEMLKKLKFDRMELPTLKTVTQAGGRMDGKLVSEFASVCKRKGIRFFSMYGQVEATARISYLDPSKISRKPESIGQAIPGGKLWLKSEMGAVIRAPNQIGELMFEGPSVCMGYASKPGDLSAPDLNRGVLATGDLATVDEDGDFYIVGRKNRFLKLFGRRVNLQDVEIFLKEQGYTVACAGKDDHLEIYVEGASSTDLGLINREVSGFLKLSRKACSVYAIDKLPLTASGKIKYADLRAVIQE